MYATVTTHTTKTAAVKYFPLLSGKVGIVLH